MELYSKDANVAMSFINRLKSYSLWIIPGKQDIVASGMTRRSGIISRNVTKTFAPTTMTVYLKSNTAYKRCLKSETLVEKN
ncbi:hypothetical protein RZE82_05815 [Mollicutes bacterium LVI A0039]|nr:hypothetical protein RZE82_05815 [Mollicutes bacterium LVI A0039]